MHQQYFPLPVGKTDEIRYLNSQLWSLTKPLINSLTGPSQYNALEILVYHSVHSIIFVQPDFQNINSWRWEMIVMYDCEINTYPDV